LQNIAGSVFDDDNSFIRNQLSAEIINNVLKISRNLEERSFMETYKQRSMILGEHILYKKDNSWHEGYASDIDDCGGLIVYTSEGQKITLSSGEVSIKKK
jgi:BirA family biotin operon repressor/biotin-[acetyl-CoA-carboxylase] ligase